MAMAVGLSVAVFTASGHFCNFENDTLLKGATLGFPASSKDECCDLCGDLFPPCSGATFSVGTCWLIEAGQHFKKRRGAGTSCTLRLPPAAPAQQSDLPDRNLSNASHGASPGLCEWYQTALKGTGSAGALWSARAADIIAASRHRNDAGFKSRSLYAALYGRLPPSVLQAGLMHLPVDRESTSALARVAGVFEARARPVRILVLGGSVTLGMGCGYFRAGAGQFNPAEPHIKWSQPIMGGVGNRDCAWPARLESIINELAGYKAVEVLSLAVGGTNSAQGATILKFELFPRTFKPDVVINGYSTNDMHVNTMRDASAENTTLQEFIEGLLERFVREAIGLDVCTKPLLVLLDDYLGNEQHAVRQTFAINSALGKLSSYYDVMAVSFANVARRAVYLNTTEGLFGPNWYWSGAYKRNVHPGSLTHLSIVWLLLHAGMMSIAGHCDRALEARTRMYARPPVPRVLPPPLNSAVVLKNISFGWARANRARPIERCEGRGGSKRCEWSWMGNLPGASTGRELHATLDDVIDPSSSWIVSDSHGKIGLSPALHPTQWADQQGHWTAANGAKELEFNNISTSAQPGAEFTMSLPPIVQPAQSLVLRHMVSYGENFVGATAMISVIANGTTRGFARLEGNITAKITVSVDTQVLLRPAAPPHSIIRLTGRLLSGKHFKLTGMALCSTV